MTYALANAVESLRVGLQILEQRFGVNAHAQVLHQVVIRARSFGQLRVDAQNRSPGNVHVAAGLQGQHGLVKDAQHEHTIVARLVLVAHSIVEARTQLALHEERIGQHQRCQKKRDVGEESQMDHGRVCESKSNSQCHM